MLRFVRRSAAAVLVLLLGACAAQEQKVVAPGAGVPAEAAFDQAAVDRAIWYMEARPEDHRSGWSRAVVLASGTGAEGRWVGVVVYSSGTVRSLEGIGEGNGALALLLSPGDSILLDESYGRLYAEDVTLLHKGAVPS